MSWGTFSGEAPALEAVGRQRLAGRVCYLATTTATSSAPRVHPVTPIISGERLFLFMEPASPKGRDLDIDPRYALHCGVEDDAGGAGEFFVSGTAQRTTDPALRLEAVAAASYAPADRYVLFQLLVAKATLRRYIEGVPRSQSWRSSTE